MTFETFASGPPAASGRGLRCVLIGRGGPLVANGKRQLSLPHSKTSRKFGWSVGGLRVFFLEEDFVDGLVEGGHGGFQFGGSVGGWREFEGFEAAFF